MSLKFAAQGVVWKGESGILLGRIEDANKVLITDSNVTSITCTVLDLQAGTSVTVAIVKNDAIVVLVNDPSWTVDDTGYNFTHTIPDTVFALATTYNVIYKFTDSSGVVSKIIFKVEGLATGE